MGFYIEAACCQSPLLQRKQNTKAWKQIGLFHLRVRGISGRLPKGRSEYAGEPEKYDAVLLFTLRG